MDMQNESTELCLQCDRELAIQIQATLKGMPESQCHIAERRNIHGEASAVVLIATLFLRELPTIIVKLKELLREAPIRQVQFGDINAKNISTADLVSILAKGTEKRKSGRKTSG
jgi:hypothetical protein